MGNDDGDEEHDDMRDIAAQNNTDMLPGSRGSPIMLVRVKKTTTAPLALQQHF